MHVGKKCKIVVEEETYQGIKRNAISKIIP